MARAPINMNDAKNNKKNTVSPFFQTSESSRRATTSGEESAIFADHVNFNYDISMFPIDKAPRSVYVLEFRCAIFCKNIYHKRNCAITLCDFTDLSAKVIIFDKDIFINIEMTIETFDRMWNNQWVESILIQQFRDAVGSYRRMFCSIVAKL